MAREFLMPKLGLTMEAGTIVEWLVADGEQVEAGTPVLTIETDKTETEIEATGSGRLHHVGAVGDAFACGAVIGWFLAEGEVAPEIVVATGAPRAMAGGPTEAPPSARAAGERTAGRLFASPNARRVAAQRGIDLQTVRGTGPNGRIVSEDLEGVTPARAPAAAGTATPAARHVAARLGIDLATVPPDPTAGHITREAVEAHARGVIAGTHPPATPPPAAYPLLQEPSEIIPFTGIRGTIARRMAASRSEMAQLTLHMDADVEAVVADRERRRQSGTAPSYTDYVIAAAARALLDHPIVNAQVTADGIALLPAVHVGVAVAIDGGLVVPVVTDAPTRGLDSLAAETARLGDAARTGRLRLVELEGGTFSVTTLGMFGVDGFTPIINPPNVAILGVGRIRDDVAVDDEGTVSKVPRLTLSLTWDHRVLDGAPAAEFCRSIVDYLRRPTDLDAPR